MKFWFGGCSVWFLLFKWQECWTMTTANTSWNSIFLMIVRNAKKNENSFTLKIKAAIACICTKKTHSFHFPLHSLNNHNSNQSWFVSMRMVLNNNNNNKMQRKKVYTENMEINSQYCCRHTYKTFGKSLLIFFNNEKILPLQVVHNNFEKATTTTSMKLLQVRYAQ